MFSSQRADRSLGVALQNLLELAHGPARAALDEVHPGAPYRHQAGVYGVPHHAVLLLAEAQPGEPEEDVDVVPVAGFLGVQEQGFELPGRLRGLPVEEQLVGEGVKRARRIVSLGGSPEAAEVRRLSRRRRKCSTRTPLA